MALSDEQLDEWERLARENVTEIEEEQSKWKGPKAFAFVAFTSPYLALDAIEELRRVRAERLVDAPNEAPIPGAIFKRYNKFGMCIMQCSLCETQKAGSEMERHVNAKHKFCVDCNKWVVRMAQHQRFSHVSESGTK